MESASDLVFSLLRFLGFLDEPPPIRKRFKRNRIYDDFSSDDETPVMGYKQVKKFRWSNIIPTNERCDKERKHNSHIWNVQEQLNNSHDTSTPKESCQRTEPIDHSRWSRNKPSSRPSKTAPVIDVEVYEQQEEPQVVWVKTKNTKKEPSIVHVTLEDSDKNQRDDDVVFVEEVTTPPPNRPLEYFLLKKSHAADLKKKVLSDILDETESYDNLNATSIKIKPMSKRKPIGDGKLVQDAATSRLPQKTRINVFDKINLDNELNADMYQNALKDHDPISVSSRDSSDSDVEVVPPKSTTTSSKNKDSDKDIICMSRNWLLELDSKMQKSQENVNDARPVSVITSNVNSTENEARTSSAETIKQWLAKLDAKYFSTPVKTLEKLNDGDPDLSSLSKVNSEQNETLSYKPYTAGDRALNLEPKNNSGLLMSQEKLNDAPQESVSKLNTEQDEAQSIKLNNIREWVAGLKSTYVSTAQETQEDLSNAVHKSNIVPKANSEQDGVYSFNLNTSKSPPLTAELEHETNLKKTLKKLVDARRESDIAKVKSEQNEARSYLPSTSREWLSKLDAKYACMEHTMSQKNQGNLNDVRHKMNSALNVNNEQNEVRSLKLNSTEDWLSELKSRCKYDFKKTHEKPNDSLREPLLPKVISEQNEAWSYKPDIAEQGPANLDSEHKTKQSKTEEKHQEVNSKKNTNRSFKFNTSEDLMLKLGSLYENYQQEPQGKNNNAHLKPDYIEQVSHQSQQNHELSNAESIIVEIPADDDLPALTPDQEKLVDRALEPEPQEELLVEKFNIKIHRRDLQTLSDLNWLNDEVINFYMNLLMQRSEEREDLPKVYATNTFFYPKLMQSGQAGLRRWTRKVDIFAYDLFVVPVNVGSHWCICLVDFRAHIIKYLDSRGTPNQECLDALLQYLNDEHQDKKGAPFDARGWRMECPWDIPQQMNGSDCGMFACTFAEFSSRNAAYSFTQAHMPYLRRKAALEILMGKLLL